MDELPPDSEGFSFGLKFRFVFENGKFAFGILLTENDVPVNIIGFTNVPLTDSIIAGNNSHDSTEEIDTKVG